MAYINLNGSQYKSGDLTGTTSTPIYLELLPDNDPLQHTIYQQYGNAKISPQDGPTRQAGKVHKTNPKAPNTPVKKFQNPSRLNNNNPVEPEDENRTYDCITDQQADEQVKNLYENTRQAQGATGKQRIKEVRPPKIDAFYEPLRNGNNNQSSERMQKLYEPLTRVDTGQKRQSANGASCCKFYCFKNRLCLVIIVIALLIILATVATIVGCLVQREGKISGKLLVPLNGQPPVAKTLH